MLQKIYKNFSVECWWLKSHFLASVDQIKKGNEAYNLTAEMSVIRLHDAWARFCRNLVFASACGGTLTALGLKIPRAPSISSAQDVVKILKPKFPFGPRWHDAAHCIKAATLIKTANLQIIQNAIGSASPEQELRCIRNFFAHRGEETALKVYTKFPSKIYSKINTYNFSAELMPSSTTRMETWIDDFQLIAEAAIQ